MQDMGHNFFWLTVCDRIGIMMDPFARNGWSRTTYLGFKTKKSAQSFLGWARQQGYTLDCELRKAERLAHCEWEVKIRDMDPTLQQAVIHKEARNQSGSIEQVA